MFQRSCSGRNSQSIQGEIKSVYSSSQVWRTFDDRQNSSHVSRSAHNSKLNVTADFPKCETPATEELNEGPITLPENKKYESEHFNGVETLISINQPELHDQ